MKILNWNKEKNVWLKENRGISFEDVLFYLENDCLLDDLEHQNKEKYPNQKIFVIDIENYACLVPYIESETEIFLKTIIPSRKATKQYLEDKNESEVK